MPTELPGSTGYSPLSRERIEWVIVSIRRVSGREESGLPSMVTVSAQPNSADFSANTYSLVQVLRSGSQGFRGQDPNKVQGNTAWCTRTRDLGMRPTVYGQTLRIYYRFLCVVCFQFFPMKNKLQVCCLLQRRDFKHYTAEVVNDRELAALVFVLQR